MTYPLSQKHGVPIKVTARAFKVGQVEEIFTCAAGIPGDRNKPKVVFTTTIKGNFITPQLQFSQPKLTFRYLWEKGVPSAIIKKALDITNVGPLPTSITLKIDPPFSCVTEKINQAPGKTDQIEILFDPGMWQERVSEDITRKLTVLHDNHQHKDIVQLCGEVCFPNL